MSRRRRIPAGLFAVVVAGGALAGCQAAEPGKSGTKSSSTSASPTGSGSESASPSPTTSAFGSDVSIPADGVGDARTTEVDTWTLVNQVDDVYAKVEIPTNAPKLGAQAQQAIGTWLEEFRSGAEDPVPPTTSSVTSGVTSSATGSPTVSPTSPASTDAGSSTGSPGSSSSPSSSGSADSSGSATGSGEASLRVLGQVVAARPDIAGVRLYQHEQLGPTSTERWRTFWFDPTRGEVVDGTALFADASGAAADPLGQARRLVASVGQDVGGLSDRDLFSAAAFTVDGDLVLYLPPAGTTSGKPTQVVLKKADVTPLLGNFGKQAQVAAADAVVQSSGTGSASPSGSASDAPSSGPATDSATSSAPSSVPETTTVSDSPSTTGGPTTN